MSQSHGESCECNGCLLKLVKQMKRQYAKDKNKRTASKVDSTAKAVAKQINPIGGILGAALNFGVGKFAGAITEDELNRRIKNNTHSSHRYMETSQQVFTHFSANKAVEEKAFNMMENKNRIYTFDNDVSIESISYVSIGKKHVHIIGGWVEKKSDTFGKWRKRFIVITNRYGAGCVISTFTEPQNLGNIVKKASGRKTAELDINQHFEVKLVLHQQNGCNGCVKIFNYDNLQMCFRNKSENAMKFYQNAIAEIICYQKKYKDVVKYSYLVSLQKNVNNYKLYMRLAHAYAQEKKYDECIKHYEITFNLHSKSYILVWNIEDLRNYFRDKSKQKRLELYKKMENLYEPEEIDYRYYCLLLYEMEKYDKLKSILESHSLRKCLKLSAYEEMIFWNKIYIYQRDMSLFQVVNENSKLCSEKDEEIKQLKETVAVLQSKMDALMKENQKLKRNQVM